LSLVITAVARTDVGRVRGRNEDAVLVDGVRGIAVVADGMGGHPAGNVASTLAAAAAVEELRALLSGVSPEEDSPDGLGDGMARAVREADERVRAAAEEDPSRRGMGTTLTAILVEPRSGRAVVGHVGDSRAYRLRSGSLEVLTKDHTWVQEQVDAGRLTPEQARGHPYSSVLTQGVGLENPAEPDVSMHEAEIGDVYLVCSDGLVGMVRDEWIEKLLVETLDRGLAAAADALVDAANRGGGLDNVSVALLEVRAL
jgi:protein phosphatase